jgi:hypothetical protein
VETPWIAPGQLARALERNEAFWAGTLDDYPLIWITAPNTLPGSPPPEPPTEEALWTDVDYVLACSEYQLAHAHYAGDALPVHNPWLGPDQVAAWLGAELTLSPRLNTSWVKPFIRDWTDRPRLAVDPANPWWQLYLQILRASVERGRGRWVTTYPDLHTGIDGLAAIRGPEQLLVDLLEQPEAVARAMEEMTALFRWIVDQVSAVVLPGGQGTSNWTMGWSRKRFLCVGQNDATCMISPGMFDAFCLADTKASCRHADYTIYHLDGPGALQHLDRVLAIEELNCVQWIQGAGNPPPSRWLAMLRRVQEAGKSVQVYYGPSHGDDADLDAELEILCRELDWRRLFFWAVVPSKERAEDLVARARKPARRRR